MNVAITGATGMIGSLILDHCLDSKRIRSVKSFSRRNTGRSSPKLEEFILDDFLDFSDLENEFKNIDCVYFCLGVYTGAVSDELFKKITYDYVVSFAKMLKLKSPNAKFCLLSGQGADQTETSRVLFAMYKGMAENHLLQQRFLETFIFRPAYIYPVSKRSEPNFLYKLTRTLYPLIKLFGRNVSIKSTELAETMFLSGIHGAPKSILENKDIIDLLQKSNKIDN